MIRVNRWWFYNGARGWLDCATGHRMGKGWIWEGPRGRDYCKACAIRGFKQKMPSLIDCGGWGNSRHPLQLRQT